MKFTIERAALLKALSHVQSVVERRTTIPILSNVLLRADAGQLALSATDMDVEIVERVAARIERDGQTTAPAHTLYDIVRKLREGAQIEIEIPGGRNEMVLRSGRSTFTLACLPPEDYPVMSAGELPHRFALTAADLRTLIDRTRFAISTEETRYYLNGIYLHSTKSNEAPVVRAVATDGHRLARFEMTAPEGAAGMPGIIVPRKTVLELRKLVDEGDEEVRISLGETKIRVAVGAAELTSKLIDGTFPDYGRVIPTGNDKELVVDKKDFEAAVDRVSTVSSERGRAVKLSLAGGRLMLSVTNPDSGSATEEIEVEYDSDPIDIGFNSRYLLDIASQIKSDTARFQLADAGSPTIVLDPSDDQALYVLMPMRV